jgi:thiol-disulfide isomerase/thioredoxin
MPKPGAVDRSHAGEAMPDAAFERPDGSETRLADFKGTPVLLNLWATWCAPCVAELPTLDKAAATPGVTVLAVSQDTDAAKVAPFLAQRGVKALKPYRDPKLGLSVALAANLPTTVFYGADGRERWRMAGGFDWAGTEAKALLAER